MAISVCDWLSVRAFVFFGGPYREVADLSEVCYSFNGIVSKAM